jgi:hypothetical protein
MVFLEEGRAGWLWPLRRHASASIDKVLGDSSADREAERSFDIADSVEKGVARELVADFMRPLPRAHRLWKFSVERSRDRKQYRLFYDGDFLMFAQVSPDLRRIEFFSYDPCDKENVDSGLFVAGRPAFSMSHDVQNAAWLMVQERCDYCRHCPSPMQCSCQGRREIIRACHSQQNVGCGIGHCMDVYIPSDAGSMRERRLRSKLPKWNENVESLVLDFAGRSVLTSARNFQLASEDKPGRTLCQHAKIGPSSFALDFTHPLTTIQAFGISMTTLLWN